MFENLARLTTACAVLSAAAASADALLGKTADQLETATAAFTAALNPPKDIALDPDRVGQEQ